MKIFGLRRSILLVSLFILIISISLIIYVEKFHVTRYVDPVSPTYHITDIGRMLRLYALDHGNKFPENGWDKVHKCPIWVQSLREWYPKGLGDGRQVDWNRILKSPRDPSSDPISYEMNPSVASRRMDDIPQSDWSRTPLVFEKPRLGKNRLVYYLSGNAAVLKARKR